MVPDTSKLTRRRDPHRKDCWQIYAGDIHAGSIARAAGTPNAIVAWKWSAGFYPGSEPGDIRHGTCATFDQARIAFKAAWRDFIAKRTSADLKEWRDQQEWTKTKNALRDAGKPVPIR